ncbi:MAG TPA: glycosyltransferase family 39 protein [Syntrophorhabdaceae bacterium]|nr:glycosyltransferase family 39 protein [Syntrophorhabdaceae bacterium]
MITAHDKSVTSHLILLLIFLVPLFSFGISNHALWTPDEPRVAEIGREMAETGNWAVPMLNRKPFLESPPLYYGVLAAFYRAFGVSDTVARIPSAIFCFGSVVVLFFLSTRLFNARVGFLSAFVLATTGEFFRVAHWSIVDGALTFFVLCAMACFMAAYQSESRRKVFLCYSLFYVFCTLGFYTKGFIGIVIPGIGVLVFIAFERNFRELVRMRLWFGAILFIILTAPWLIELWRQAGAEYLKIFFVHNHLQRFLPGSLAGSISGAASGHHNPFYYYITEFPAGFLPWSTLLVPVLIFVFSRQNRTFLEGSSFRRNTLFLKCWFFAGIAFLSVASTKRTLYLMPLFAPMSALTGMYLEQLLTADRLKRYEKVFLSLLSVVVIMAGLVLVPAYYYLSTEYFSQTNGGFSVLLSVGALFSCFVIIWGLIQVKRCNVRKYCVSIIFSITVIYLGTLAYFFPLIDKEKSFIPFCSEVKKTVPAGIPICGYEPDETVRAVIPFYTGNYMLEAADLEDLARIVKAGKPFFIVSRDHKSEKERELLNSGRFSPIIKKPMGRDRALLLFSYGLP